MLTVAVGREVATGLALAGDVGAGPDDDGRLRFGALEPLVDLMQETAPADLLPALVRELGRGTPLDRLVAAAACANARSFGGEDYVGYHTMMALSPSLHMARALPSNLQPLPVFKVLYRNTARIQERGGSEVLHPVAAAALPEGSRGEDVLVEAVRRQDMAAAEATFAALAAGTPDRALDQLLHAVHDHTEVHRVVLPYRAWDLLGLIGPEHAHTLLRQSVRYCVKAAGWSHPDGDDQPRSVLPRVMEEHGLLDRPAGSRRADDQRLEELVQAIFAASPVDAAGAAAAALAEGLSPDDVGEAISLAANQLVLRDRGRTPREESPGKPLGSVHGDSIGVHASDSANAWRNLSRVAGPRNRFACLILGAYQVALDRINRGGDFLNWDPLPLAPHVAQVGSPEPGALLAQLGEAIRGNLQARAAAIAHRCGELGHEPGPVFDLLLQFAISEDGSLHAEKFYRTASEEFAATRPAFRWRQLVALARVTASEFGRPAAGIAQARDLLGLA